MFLALGINCLLLSLSLAVGNESPISPHLVRETAPRTFERVGLKSVSGAPGRDVTTDLQYLDAAPEKDTLPRLLKSHRVLFVSGIFSEKMDPHALERQWLEARNVKYDVVQVVGGRSTQDNVITVANTIQSSPEPVVIFSHSKGAVDVLEALLMFEHLQKKVHGWIALQGAFGGSPLVYLFDDPWERAIADSVLRWTDGSGQMIDEMNPHRRKTRLDQTLPGIRSLLSRIPTLSLAGVATKNELDWALWSLYVLRGDSLFQNQANDGILSLESQILPFADFSVIKPFAHMDSDKKTIEVGLKYIAEKQGYPVHF